VAVWAGVVVTVAAVAVGIWYYVRDDYPFQLTSNEITGLTVNAVLDGRAVSGSIAHPPQDLAQWISSMEKSASDETGPPADTVVTVERSNGPALRLSIDDTYAAASWIGADGSATPPVRLQVNQAFLWYLRGVIDGLANTPHRVTPRQQPAAAGASPAAHPTRAASPTPSGTTGGAP